MARDFVWRRIPWPRNRHWTPGQTISIGDGAGGSVTYRLRGVMRDSDPRNAFATLTLEPLDAGSLSVGEERQAAG